MFVCLSVTWSDLRLLVQFQAPAVPFLVCRHLASEDEGVCPSRVFTGTVNRVGEISPMGKEELVISAGSLKSLRVGTDRHYLPATGLSGPTLRLAFHTAENRGPAPK